MGKLGKEFCTIFSTFVSIHRHSNFFFKFFVLKATCCVIPCVCHTGKGKSEGQGQINVSRAEAGGGRDSEGARENSVGGGGAVLL